MSFRKFREARSIVINMPQDSSVSVSPLEKIRQCTITGTEITSLLKQYGMLPKLMQELLIDDAIAPISLTSEEIFKTCQQFYQQHQLSSEADVQAWLAERGICRDQLEAIITRDARLKHFKQETWGHKLDSYFLQRKAKLDRVIYSLIRVKELGTAQELYFRIQEGEQPFSELAREHSQGVEAETGGLLGPVELGTPHPTIAKILISSQPGQLLPPTRLGEWIIILRLEKFLPAQLDEPTQQRLLNELFEDWLQTNLA